MYCVNLNRKIYPQKIYLLSVDCTTEILEIVWFWENIVKPCLKTNKDKTRGAALLFELFLEFIFAVCMYVIVWTICV